eukprot:m.14941 g.14941  ORF g.14941 m.14941 type:complete len:75 (+) comp5255_c0_seq1:231-455(+)
MTTSRENKNSLYDFPDLEQTQKRKSSFFGRKKNRDSGSKNKGKTSKKNKNSMGVQELDWVDQMVLRLALIGGKK